MRTLRALIDVFRKTDASQRELEDAAHEADQAADAAEAEMAAAEAAYRAALLGDDKTLARLDEARRAAVLKRDRARALTDELDRRIVVAANEANRARRQAQHDDAAAKCAAIQKRLAVEYPKHATAIRALLHDLAEAELARERAMIDASDLGWIAPPEDVARGLDALPEEIVRRERVDLWMEVGGRPEPLIPDDQRRVQPVPLHPRKGVLTGGSNMNVRTLDCILVAFERVTYREAVGRPTHAGTLLQTVNLPQLDAYADPFVTASNYRGTEGSIAHLAGAPSSAPPLDRPERVRLERVVDDASREAA